MMSSVDFSALFIFIACSEAFGWKQLPKHLRGLKSRWACNRHEAYQHMYQQAWIDSD